LIETSNNQLGQEIPEIDIKMENKKMEKRDNNEKEKIEEELGRLMEITLKLEDELNWLS
jgi:hypothetical protein